MASRFQKKFDRAADFHFFREIWKRTLRFACRRRAHGTGGTFRLNRGRASGRIRRRRGREPARRSSAASSIFSIWTSNQPQRNGQTAPARATVSNRKSACSGALQGVLPACFFSKALGRAFCGDIPGGAPLPFSPTRFRQRKRGMAGTTEHATSRTERQEVRHLSMVAG